MESIDKLRKKDGEMLIPLGNGQYVPDHSHNDIADEIEQEIAERYLELPTDADGVPIKVGDECCSTVTGEEFSVTSLERTNVGWWVWYEPSKNLAVEYVAHVKPRTLEDVLNELVEAVRYERVCDKLLSETSIDDFAAEIREILGVDA